MMRKNHVPDRPGLSLRQIEGALAAFLKVHPDRRGSLTSRLRQWQTRNSFPPGTNVGSGRRAHYGLEQFLQLAFLGHLLETGLTPDRGIQLIEALWARIRDNLYDVFVCLAGGAEHRHYLSLRVNSLAGLQDPNHPGKLGLLFEIAGFTSEDLRVAYSGESDAPFPERIKKMTSTRVERTIESLIVDLDGLMGRSLAALQRQEGVELADFADEISGWKVSAHTHGTNFHIVSDAYIGELEQMRSEGRQAEVEYPTPPDEADGLALVLFGASSQDEVRAREPDPYWKQSNRWKAYHRKAARSSLCDPHKEQTK